MTKAQILITIGITQDKGQTPDFSTTRQALNFKRARAVCMAIRA
jgi:hypothetical protein